MTDRHPLHDFLMEDFKHFSQSLWHNDDAGEKRFNFFLALVTAVLGGLVTLHTSKNSVEPKSAISLAAVAGLLALGILTYARLLLRNRVTNEYHRTLKYIRRHLLSLYPDTHLDSYKVPVKVSEDSFWKALKGGLAGLTGALNAMLLAILIALLPLTEVWGWASAIQIGIATIVGVAAFLMSWRFAANRGTQGGSGQYFRAGVGAVIFNEGGQVLALERSKNPGAWQLPQGGLEQDETPSDGVLREIREETGLHRSALVFRDEYPEVLAYELPEEARSDKTGRGQVHHWFFYRFVSEKGNIKLSFHGEFRDYTWMSFKDLLQIVEKKARFRKSTYEKLAEYACKRLSEFAGQV